MKCVWQLISLAHMERFCFDFPRVPLIQTIHVQVVHTERWDDNDFVLPTFPLFAKTHTYGLSAEKTFFHVERMLTNTEQ